MSDSPETLLGKELTKRGVTLALAESCSGGLIAHRVTNVPGASAYFLGGVVVYSNEAKTRLLGVPPADLERYGAVSEPVAHAMAAGALRLFGAGAAIAVTGIAGPGGGSPEKPVGLVYIAVAEGGRVAVERNLFEGGRDDIKRQTADRALTLLTEYLP